MNEAMTGKQEAKESKFSKISQSLSVIKKFSIRNRTLANDIRDKLLGPTPKSDSESVEKPESTGKLEEILFLQNDVIDILKYVDSILSEINREL